MGRESKVFKDRQCRQCGMRLFATAQELIEHLTDCRIHARLGKLGLVVPGTILEPRVEIVRP